MKSEMYALNSFAAAVDLVAVILAAAMYAVQNATRNAIAHLATFLKILRAALGLTAALLSAATFAVKNRVRGSENAMRARIMADVMREINACNTRSPLFADMRREMRARLRRELRGDDSVAIASLDEKLGAFRVSYRLSTVPGKTWELLVPASATMSGPEIFAEYADGETVSDEDRARLDALTRCLGPAGNFHGAALDPAAFGIARKIALTEIGTLKRHTFSPKQRITLH